LPVYVASYTETNQQCCSECEQQQLFNHRPQKVQYRSDIVKYSTGTICKLC